MYVYIGYRDLAAYYMQNACMGGKPVNNDYRLYTFTDGIYVLHCGGADYAVSTDEAEKFVKEVLSGTTGKHPGYFPLVSDFGGKKTAAVVEIRDEADCSYYDFDDQLLLKMLDDLKDRSTLLPDRRAYINYCYPNPELPEGDFELKSIYHQIYAPDDTPPSVINTYRPDLRSSSFWKNDDGLHLEVREENSKTSYEVPAELIPEIKDKVRLLCADPAEAYVEYGGWESFVHFGDDDKRIFTDPDRTFALLKEIASQSVVSKTEEVKAGPMPNNGQFNGFMGMLGLSGLVGIDMPPEPPKEAAPPGPGEWKCPFCGKNNTGKFCIECGTERKEEGK
ncbi:MAG: hypothetical protein J6Z43_04765 [Clostridiales bacterium]|nr:hypothetical protein [Clostridiales bacterium]